MASTTLNRLRRSVSTLSHQNQHQGLFNYTRHDSLPSQIPSLLSTTRSFLDFYQIAAADKTIIPVMSAVKFPELAVTLSNGKVLKLPITSGSSDVNTESLTVPKVSLVCLSFRASSQEMISSWSKPFLESFGDRKDLQVFEVSFIDKWLLGLAPIKKLLLHVLQKQNNNENSVLRRQVVYSFGDHYHFRKEIKVLNLLTGYILLLDKFGRIRWQGFGTATPEEVSHLLSCTSLLLKDQ